MPDDKTKVGEPDRSRVAAEQNYEVRYLAQKFGLSDEQARELIARVGNDREKLDEAAQELHERLSRPRVLGAGCFGKAETPIRHSGW